LVVAPRVVKRERQTRASVLWVWALVLGVVSVIYNDAGTVNIPSDSSYMLVGRIEAARLVGRLDI
jgi:hypothetical protein